MHKGISGSILEKVPRLKKGAQGIVPMAIKKVDRGEG
jgi:hypothetical protein